jgi:dienelactone hydrolase
MLEMKWLYNMKYNRSILTVMLVVGSAQSASVLDLFPDTGLKSAPGKSSCSFEYAPSGSMWTDGCDEQAVFLASVKGDGWSMGIGKGGQIYSLQGPYGESVPPQRVASPWNDEVWQSVVTSEERIGPVQDYQNANRDNWNEIWNATFPLMYFVHQAGIYTKGAGTDGGAVAAPFYSPCLRKRWNAETRTLELVNWMQQARTPCVWKSGVLIYTAYRDLGDGVIEVNQVLYNFGTETLTFLNTPWGGVRDSSLPEVIISNPDGSWEKTGGTYGWTDIPTRHLVNTGGWMAWTQDPEKDDSPSLALVFGTDENDVSNGKRKDEAIRWGNAGNDKVRDYEVAERMSHAYVEPGDSWSIRWYLVSGKLSNVTEHAGRLSAKSGVSELTYDASGKQAVWVAADGVKTDGAGKPSFELCAFPAKGTVPVFLLEDKRTGKQLITTDIYALAETEPFPNPLPEELEIYPIYNDRVVYKQYAPHIGYKNLLGYAFKEKPEGMAVSRLKLPVDDSVSLHESAKEIWIPAFDQPFAEELKAVSDLSKLLDAPVMMDAEGFAPEGNLKPIYYEALDYKGKPTKVFAWLGLPEGRSGKVPGVVLVHGGGGTAFKEWVRKWNEQGFAAISIAVEGQTDVKNPDSKDRARAWKQHAWPGPHRHGIYGDSSEPLKDQWMYHAVADAILANSLLRSLPEVDADKVGIMGISWGGVITSTVMGIDDRFAFAIPTYGCGSLATAENQYGRSLGKNELYKQVWDPMVRLSKAAVPTLWLSWPGDQHFPLDKLADSYNAMAGVYMVSLIPGMKHGHGSGWNPPDSYAFGRSIVDGGGGWCTPTSASVAGGRAEALFESHKLLDSATLISTVDTGVTGSRKWVETPAEITEDAEYQWRVQASLPPGTTAWFINVKSGGLTSSSRYQTGD